MFVLYSQKSPFAFCISWAACATFMGYPLSTVHIEIFGVELETQTELSRAPPLLCFHSQVCLNGQFYVKVFHIMQPKHCSGLKFVQRNEALYPSKHTVKERTQIMIVSVIVGTQCIKALRYFS